MRLSDRDSFYKYFRMTPSRFDHLLSLIGPQITRQHTNFRSPISGAERLAVTLRFLTTGDSMQTIAFSYRMGHSTVCTIIPETCDAIWNALAPEYLRTPSNAEEWKTSNSSSKTRGAAAPSTRITWASLLGSEEPSLKLLRSGKLQRTNCSPISNCRHSKSAIFISRNTNYNNIINSLLL